LINVLKILIIIIIIISLKLPLTALIYFFGISSLLLFIYLSLFYRLCTIMSVRSFVELLFDAWDLEANLYNDLR